MIIDDKEIEGYRIIINHGELNGPLPVLTESGKVIEVQEEKPKEVKQESFWRWLKNGLAWSKNK